MGKGKKGSLCRSPTRNMEKERINATNAKISKKIQKAKHLPIFSTKTSSHVLPHLTHYPWLYVYICVFCHWQSDVSVMPPPTFSFSQNTIPNEKILQIKLYLLTYALFLTRQEGKKQAYMCN
uniref:Uncharacterized protein n=1 Tax=Glossina austeni TaxID=7395 RepID=A0A1A9UUL8_GLOAU